MLRAVKRLPRVLLGSSLAVTAAILARRSARRSRPATLPPHMPSLLPVLGSTLALMRGPTKFQRDGHARLGPVFSATILGLELTFVDHGELLGRVLAASSEEYNLGAAYRQLVGKLLGEELFLEAPPEAMRGLSTQQLRRQTPALCTFMADLIAARMPGRSAEFDLLGFCNMLVLHASCWYVCGATVPEATRDELAGLFHVLESDYSVFGSLTPIETPSTRRRIAARNRVLEIFRAEVRRRLADPGDNPDYLQSLLDVYAPQQAGPATEAQIERAAIGVMGLVFGAHTNTAVGLAAVLLDLHERPAVLAAVRAEQAQVLGDRALDLETLMRMPTLFRAITETLRLRSNGGVWRKLLKPTELGGYLLPTGTLVGSMMGLINGDETIFPRPCEYDPERYAAMQTDNFQCPAVGAHDPKFGAFGAGRHVCPGRQLAYVILGAAASLLLRERRFTLKHTPRMWFDLMTAGLARPIGKLTATVAPAS
jgi:sterol 14-demethylase